MKTLNRCWYRTFSSIAAHSNVRNSGFMAPGYSLVFLIGKCEAPRPPKFDGKRGADLLHLVASRLLGQTASRTDAVTAHTTKMLRERIIVADHVPVTWAQSGSNSRPYSLRTVVASLVVA